MTDKLRIGIPAGFCFLAAHSLAVSWAFLYVHHSKDGQAVFVYFPFFEIDAPTVPWVMAAEGRWGFLSAITHWWYARGHQGVNLRAFILIGLFGGLHWFVLGYILARTVSWARQRLRRHKAPQ